MSESIDGSFTLATTLSPNLSNVFITPSAFSFSDGIDTISNINAAGALNFEVSTNGSGQIVNWFIALRELSATSSLGYYISTANLIGDHPMQLDIGQYYNCGNGTTSAGSCAFYGTGFYVAEGESFDPGTWAESSVPEPGTLLLLGMTVAWLGALRWRRSFCE